MKKDPIAELLEIGRYASVHNPDIENHIMRWVGRYVNQFTSFGMIEHASQKNLDYAAHFEESLMRKMIDGIVRGAAERSSWTPDDAPVSHVRYTITVLGERKP